MSHEPAARCDDPSTWNHKDEKIDLPRLLALIEAHGSPEGLDLHGCDMTGIDLSYAAVSPYLQQWTGTQPPPWVYGMWGVSLRGAHLEEAKLTSANLKGADLLFARLERTFFFSAKLDGAAIVRAHANGVTILHCSARDAVFNNSDLTAAILMATDFAGASFGGAILRRAQLKDANLVGVDLRLTDMRGAMLHGARFEKTKLRPSNFARRVGEELVASRSQEMHYRVSYFEAADVYLDLKANFSALGYYDAVSWAYVKERQMEKMAYFQEWTRRGSGLFQSPLRCLQLVNPRSRRLRRWLRLWLTRPSTWISFARWLRNWVYELLTGYGERPFNPVAGGVVVATVIFPLLFWAVGALPGHGRAFTSSSPSDIDWAGWGDSVVFSLTSFGTLSFSRLQPEGTLPNLIAAFEAMIGVLLFALFVFTLGNRMSRS